MSRGTESASKNIEFNDLPLEEPLTQEEKEELAGAGRFRPSFEALEAREMMDAKWVPAPLPKPDSPPAEVRVDDTVRDSGKESFVQYGQAADASAAIVVGNGKYMFVGDDKGDVIRLYEKDSGRLISYFQLGDNKFTGNQNTTKYSDIEGATRIGDRIYWIGSGGRYDAGYTAQNVIFATDIKNEFSTTDTPALKYVGQFTGLREAIGSWAAQAAVVARLGINLQVQQNTPAKMNGGYNVEGMVALDDGSAYIALRSPVVGPKKEAVLVRVSNFASLFPPAGSEQSFVAPQPTFGEPAMLDLGGRGIRDIVWNKDWGVFVLIGGSPTTENLKSRIYLWDGLVNNEGSGKVVAFSTPDSVGDNKAPDWTSSKPAYMSYEAIADTAGTLEDLLAGRATVRMLADAGGSKTHGTDIKDFKQRWFYGQDYTFPNTDKTMKDALVAYMNAIQGKRADSVAWHEPDRDWALTNAG